MFVSMLWGTIGMGFFVYGKKQRSAIPLFGGLALMGITYFIESTLIMSIVACGLIAGMIYLGKR